MQLSCQSFPYQQISSFPLRITPFQLDLNLSVGFSRKQAKISSENKVDFYFSPMSSSPEKKSIYRKKLCFEDDPVESFSLTPTNSKRTFSESTLVQKQISDNRKYLKIQKKLVDRGLSKVFLPLSIKTTKNIEHPDLPSIEASILNELMEEKGRNVIVIDSRYSFEYEAGHISKSININNPFNLESLFFEYGHLLFSQNFLKKLPFFSKIEKKEQENWLKEQNNDKMNYEDLLEEPPVIVIHCEFSQKRGPKLFRYMRKRDREINESHYPNLIYPNILLLSGGYSSYVKDFPNSCTENGGYISMFNEKFKLECSFENSCYNKLWTDVKNTKYITNFY